MSECRHNWMIERSTVAYRIVTYKCAKCPTILNVDSEAIRLYERRIYNGERRMAAAHSKALLVSRIRGFITLWISICFVIAGVYFIKGWL